LQYRAEQRRILNRASLRLWFEYLFS
jgi:hypothetical protein